MAKKKYYAVKEGVIPGIYETWENCKDNVLGVSGANFKAFTNKKDANRYMTSSKDRYYAVKKGKKPGIYTSAQSYEKNMKGYSGCQGRVFKTRIEAESYMKSINYKAKKTKYYAVKVGRNPGIYLNLDDYNNNVRKFSGAKGRVFICIEKAKKYLEFKGGELDITKKRFSKRMDVKARELSREKNTICIYSDGGWHEGVYSSGFVVIKNGDIIDRVCISGKDVTFDKLASVAAELNASAKAIDYVFNNMPYVENVYVFVDFVGSMHWSIPMSEGGWERRNDFTKEYGEYMEAMRDEFNINFFHVKGHSNDPFNEEADRLSTYGKELYLENKEFDIDEFMTCYSYMPI